MPRIRAQQPSEQVTRRSTRNNPNPDSPLATGLVDEPRRKRKTSEKKIAARPSTPAAPIVTEEHAFSSPTMAKAFGPALGAISALGRDHTDTYMGLLEENERELIENVIKEHDDERDSPDTPEPISTPPPPQPSEPTSATTTPGFLSIASKLFSAIKMPSFGLASEEKAFCIKDGIKFGRYPKRMMSGALQDDNKPATLATPTPVAPAPIPHIDITPRPSLSFTPDHIPESARAKVREQNLKLQALRAKRDAQIAEQRKADRLKHIREENAIKMRQYLEEEAQQQPGEKRKRIRVEDIVTIPHRRPDQPSGTFSLVDGFFDYDADQEESFIDIDERLVDMEDQPNKRRMLDLKDESGKAKPTWMDEGACAQIKAGTEEYTGGVKRSRATMEDEQEPNKESEDPCRQPKKRKTVRFAADVISPPLLKEYQTPTNSPNLPSHMPSFISRDILGWRSNVNDSWAAKQIRDNVRYHMAKRRGVDPSTLPSTPNTISTEQVHGIRSPADAMSKNLTPFSAAPAPTTYTPGPAMTFRVPDDSDEDVSDISMPDASLDSIQTPSDTSMPDASYGSIPTPSPPKPDPAVEKAMAEATRHTPARPSGLRNEVTVASSSVVPTFTFPAAIALPNPVAPSEEDVRIGLEKFVAGLKMIAV
ncbi:MAG: hypothetical protein M1820_005951 [Bogoriella megaspora]|nr:MAG: hypothetical protein M1820_005951 [Bogoriella megaspora]